MNKKDEKILSKATNRLLIDLQNTTDKLKLARSEARKWKKRFESKEELWDSARRKCEELEADLVKMLVREKRRCPCDEPENCVKIRCLRLATEATEQQLAESDESSSDSE